MSERPSHERKFRTLGSVGVFRIGYVAIALPVGFATSTAIPSEVGPSEPYRGRPGGHRAPA